MIAIFPRYYNPTLLVDMSGVKVRFADGKGLQVRFHVERTLSQAPDKCEIEIVGMDPVRAALMLTVYQTLGADTITIKAGYDGITAGLFAGDVRSVDGPRRIGRDDVLRIVADDAGDAVAETAVRISSVSLTALQGVMIAAAQMGLLVHPTVSTVLAAKDPAKQGPFATVITGKATDLLDVICRRVRSRWRIQDGQIILIAEAVFDPTRPAVVLTSATLVSAPAPGGTPGTHRFVAFLDPNIVPGSQVSYLSAMYRAENVVYSGETRSGPWTVDVTGSAL